MDRDLEAVPLCPVIDESRGDKEREERTERKQAKERGGRGNTEVRTGQRKGFLPLVLKQSRV